MFKILPSEHDEPVRYAIAFISVLILLPILVVIIIFFARDRLELAAHKSLIKEFLHLTNNDNCIDAYSYLNYNLINRFEVIKSEALNKEHGRLYISRCIKVIANDLKANMTQKQINNLKPIDLFCWWNKHYNLLPQGSYDISLNIIRHKGTLYDYDIKDKGKVIAHIGVSLAESKIESIKLCSDYLILNKYYFP